MSQNYLINESQDTVTINRLRTKYKQIINTQANLQLNDSNGSFLHSFITNFHINITLPLFIMYRNDITRGKENRGSMTPKNTHAGLAHPNHDFFARLQRTNTEYLEEDNSPCRRCQFIVTDLQIKNDDQINEIENLRQTIIALESQNQALVNEARSVVDRFSSHIEQLEEEIKIRDQTNEDLKSKLKEQSRALIRNQIEQASREQDLRNQWESREQQYKEIVESLTKEYTTQIQEKEKQLSSYRSRNSSHVDDQTKKNLNKLLTEQRKWQIERLELEEEIKRVQDAAENKEKLIKCLSISNDELRLELLGQKRKERQSDLTSTTDLKSITDGKIDALEKENSQLKDLIQNLQSEIVNLVGRGQKLQDSLIKVSIERDNIKRSKSRQQLSLNKYPAVRKELSQPTQHSKAKREKYLIEETANVREKYRFMPQNFQDLRSQL